MILGGICLFIGVFLIIRGFVLFHRKQQSSKTNKEKTKNILMLISNFFTGWFGFATTDSQKALASSYIGVVFIFAGIVFSV